MFPSLHKLAMRFTPNLLAVALLTGVAGCKQTKDETWHIYDRNGKPVPDAIVICSYTLANSGKGAVNYRIGKPTGEILLDLDEDTPDGLDRGYSCVYSPRLRNGDTGLGQRWHEGEPIPDGSVYFDEWNHKIRIKSGVEDPLIWHHALNSLIAGYFNNICNDKGGAKLRKELGPIVSRERSLFLEKYGEELVPAAYLDKTAVNAYYPSVFKKKNTGLKFKDITLQIPSL